MLDPLIHELSLDWRDPVDILIITVLLYKVIKMFRGTRALTAALGLGILMLLFFFSYKAGLYTTTWILQNVMNSLFLVVVILFQKDIRQILGEVGARYFGRHSSLEKDTLDELVSACVDMARLRIGALIIIERTLPLGDMIRQEGIGVDAKISRKLLTSIFFPNSPLHDGAIIISKGKISAAGCILPLAIIPGQNFGTRHRAALGITEESDALAIVISEERGEIRVASKGEFTPALNGTKLTQVISHAL